MTKICLAAAVLAMSLMPAFAVTPKADAQPSVQAQIAQLQQQVTDLQKKIEDLQTRNQPVCISFWCGTVISGSHGATPPSKALLAP